MTVKLLVDTTGAVTKVELLTPPAPPFDEAVMAAARGFRFDPGRYGGKPVSVAITFTQKFLPRARPPRPPRPARRRGPALTAVLRGRLVELGTRRPLAAATVTALVGDQYYTTESDAGGHFRLPLPPGPARVSVFAAEHNTFVQQETLAARQELAVTYLVERERYNLYETVVVAERRREEVSRITLRGDEIQKSAGHVRGSVPGDPDAARRVVGRVAAARSRSCAARAPARRASCSTARASRCCSTCCPGPASFTPSSSTRSSSSPAARPRRTAATWAASSTAARGARARTSASLDFDVNLLQAGGFVRAPVAPLGATVTAAGRYGYPGFLLGLATNQVSLSYWDYQLRDRRRHAGQRLDGLPLRRPRRAGHAGAHGDGERSQPAARSRR